LPKFSLILDGTNFGYSARKELAVQRQFPEQFGDKAPWVLRMCEQPHIAQRIQIDLYTKSTNVLVPEPIQNLTKICIPLPADSIEHFPVGCTNTNQIASTSVVRT
jgi:hypothetical protein